jgi:hypothetical protein
MTDRYKIDTVTGQPVRLDFSLALNRMRRGFRVTRRPGSGTWIGIQPGYPDGVPANRNTANLLQVPEGTPVTVEPYLVLRTAEGGLVPWTASSSDILADDWCILVNEPYVG